VLLKDLHAISRGAYGVDLAESLGKEYSEVVRYLNFVEDTTFGQMMEDFLENNDTLFAH